MKKTIKILSLILAFVIALVPFCASAYKVDGFTLEIKDWIQNDGIWFYDPNPIDNTAAICGYMGQDKDVVIPEIVGDKYKVTELKLNTPDMFENDAGGFPVLTSAANIETLTLPKTLKLISIGDPVVHVVDYAELQNADVVLLNVLCYLQVLIFHLLLHLD